MAPTSHGGNALTAMRMPSYAAIPAIRSGSASSNQANFTLQESRKRQLVQPMASSTNSPTTASASSSLSTMMIPKQCKIRSDQEALWQKKLNDLKEYFRIHGHCHISSSCAEHRELGQWIKRQRHQYKLKQAGQRSTLTDERKMAMDSIGFDWTPRPSLWEDRLAELLQFREEHGHCNVPARYARNTTLAVWVKCQRRQYKTFQLGQKSNMTPERVQRLNNVEFVWDPRSDKRVKRRKQQRR
mmetsp:Transcript_8792/g.25302  ORF Transcript_8792/g.25302 Transcript_8792/m.25302 type:complete len:242 (-) Transcript_8792:223-948(-)